jgi:prophage endopeptidase
MFQLLSLRVKTALLLSVVVLACLAVGWLTYSWQQNKYETLLSKKELEYATALLTVNKAAADVAQAALAAQSVAQQQLAVLDKKATEQRSHDLAENARLNGLLASGGRVHVKGSCTPSQPAASVPKASGSSSVDDGSSVELSGTAGRNVLGIREGIVKDRAALKFFQDRESRLTE